MKTARRASTPPARPSAAAGFGAFAESQRQQMAVAGEAAGTLFRGMEAIRQIQQKSAQEAIARHSAAARALKPADPLRMAMAHAQLLREDLEASARCWQEIAAAAMETQSELAACCTHLVDTETALQASAAFGH